MDRLSVKDFDFDRDEIERRKQLIRDLWTGKPVDHIPIHFVVSESGPLYTICEQLQNADKQLETALMTTGLSWKSVPKGDYIPAMRPDVGCSCMATTFGAELFWGDDPNQTCGVKEPVLENIYRVYDLQVPPPDAGQFAEGIKRVKLFAEAGQGLVSVSLLDMAGGLNVANDLLGSEALYLSMYENPEELKCLLGKIQKLFLGAIDKQIEAAGGQEFITTTDFPDYWFPEDRKGHVSDDISAYISPELYKLFSLPYHNMIFEKYGGGGLHNCGPNPCLAEYLKHIPQPKAFDLSFRFSKNDLPKIKLMCRRRVIIYMAEIADTPQKIIETYREIMELMSPYVIVIPVVCITINDSPAEVYVRLREISEEYAKRMDWGWICEEAQ